MYILWIIIIGFVAGVIAKLVTPGENKPKGFILTTTSGLSEPLQRLTLDKPSAGMDPIRRPVSLERLWARCSSCSCGDLSSVAGAPDSR